LLFILRNMNQRERFQELGEVPSACCLRVGLGGFNNVSAKTSLFQRDKI